MFLQNHCSQSIGISVHVRPESAFLVAKTRVLDPEGEGLSIRTEMIDPQTKISIDLRNVTLIEALQYICTLGGLEVHFSEGDQNPQVLVRPKNYGYGAFVSGEVLIPKGLPVTKQSSRVLKEFFESIGLRFADRQNRDGGFVFDTATRKAKVRCTEETLMRLTKICDQLRKKRN